MAAVTGGIHKTNRRQCAAFCSISFLESKIFSERLPISLFMLWIRVNDSNQMLGAEYAGKTCMPRVPLDVSSVRVPLDGPGQFYSFPVLGTL